MVFLILLYHYACINAEILLDKIKLPNGFQIDIYADNVKGARSMVMSPGGTLFIGTRKIGNVYAVLDKNKDNKADEIIIIAKDLNMPNGVAVKDGALFVSDDKAGAVYRISYK